jgi:hypothetical protein
MTKPRLQVLLEKNSVRNGELDVLDCMEAIGIIEDSKPLEEKCWVCNIAAGLNPKYKPKEAIYEKGLCKDHATQALEMGIKYN